MNIIIFYQIINREMESCKKLKMQLDKERNIQTFIFSIDFEYDKAVDLCKKRKIDMVVMPWMYHDSNYMLVQPFIRFNPKVFIINLHQEQLGSEATDSVLVPTGENAKNSVIHFIWGDFFKEKLLSAGVRENLIFVTGNIRSNSAKNTSKSRAELSKEFRLDIKKKWIIFSENRGWVLTDTKRKQEHIVYLGLSRNDIEYRKRINEDSLNYTLRELDELPDSFFDSYELIYRPHPGTKVPDAINNRVKAIYKYPIYEWLNNVDGNIVWSSTTIFESDVIGIPSIVYEPIENPKRFKTYGLENYQTIRKLSEINEALIETYKNSISNQKIYERYIGKADGKAIDRAKSAIIKILNEGLNGYTAKKSTYSKIAYFKHCFLYQKITRVFVKCGLLDILKFPRSAYELRNEIPYRNK